MKKLIALFVISLFLASVIPATVSADAATDLNKVVKKKYTDGVKHYKQVTGKINQHRGYIGKILGQIRASGEIEDPAALRTGLMDFIETTTTELENIRDNLLDYTCIDESNPGTVDFINGVISDGDALYAELEATDPESTDIEYYREKIAAIKAYHNNKLGPALKRFYGKTVACKIDNMLINFELLYARLTTMVEKADANGLDTTEAWNLLDQMRAEIDSLYDSYDNVKTYWVEEADTYKEKDKAYQETKRFFREDLNKKLKNAHKRAVEIYKDLKRQSKGSLGDLKTVQVDSERVSISRVGSAEAIGAKPRTKDKDSGVPTATVAGNPLITDTTLAGAQTDESQQGSQ